MRVKAASLVVFILLSLSGFSQARSSSSWDAAALYAQAKALTPADLAALRRRAQAGDARSQFLVGLAYENGYAGLVQDKAEALRWHKRAAAQNIGLAEYWVGGFYRSGVGGVPTDYLEALNWYRRAADHGEAGGAAMAGWLYAFGDGVAADHRMAAQFYRRAEKLGYPQGHYYANLLESDCLDEFCVALRQMLLASWGGFQRFRGLPDPDLSTQLEDEVWVSSKTLPGFQKCWIEKQGTESGPLFWCDSGNLGGSESHSRFAELSKHTRSALPANWFEKSNQRSNGSNYYGVGPIRDGAPSVSLTRSDYDWSGAARTTVELRVYQIKP